MNWKGSISLSVVVQVLNITIGFISAILLTRLLGAEGRGDYILLTTTAVFMMQAFSLGLESSISYYIASGKTELRKLISTVLILFVGITICVGITILFLSAFPALGLVPATQTVYYIMLFVLTSIYIANAFFASLFNGLKEFNKVILISLSIQLMTLVACIGFFLLGYEYANAKSFTYAIILVNAAITAVYLFYYKKLINLAPRRNMLSTGELKDFFSYSFIAFLCSLLHFLIMRMDFWMVHHYYGSSSLGIYSLSTSLSQLLWILPQGVALILFPMSGYMKVPELTTVTNKLCRISLFITLLLVPAGCICALFIPALFGEEFTASVSLFYIFLIGVIPHVLVMILASVFAGTGKVKYNLLASFTGFVFACIFYFLLIPAYGLTGGAFASSISYIATALVGIYLYKKQYKIYLKDILVVRQSDVRVIFNRIKPAR